LALTPCVFSYLHGAHRALPSFPTRRSSDLPRRPIKRSSASRRCTRSRKGYGASDQRCNVSSRTIALFTATVRAFFTAAFSERVRSEEHTSELQSRENLVCRLLLEKKKKKKQ